MTTEWMDKPDGDGWFDVASDGYRNAHAIVVRGESCAYIKIDGQPHFPGGIYKICELIMEGKKFRRINLQELPPYVPPKPPKVTQYTAQYKFGGQSRFITKIGEEYRPYDTNGSPVGTWCNWSLCSEYYTDIKPIEAS